MKNKRKQYIRPHSKVVVYSPYLNSGNGYDPGTETGYIGFGSGPKDPGLGQAKGNNTFEEETDEDEMSSWNVWQY